MAATPGELALLIQLTKLSGGQAPGSFGPSQALSLLAGYIKLRDHIDLLDTNLTDLIASVAKFAGIDAATRIAALEQAHTDDTNAIAALDKRITTLEQAAPPPAA